VTPLDADADTDPVTGAARNVLDSERHTTRQRISALTAEFDEIVAGAADANGDDEHDPEGSTIAFERAQVGSLLLEARAYLDDLDHALTRLDTGTYWNCAQCGASIAPERLAARPATSTCIACASRSIATGRGSPRSNPLGQNGDGKQRGIP
jgi:RNA polymerase-binding transcription factor DksA